jgi:homoserine dehydrogenase
MFQYTIEFAIALSSVLSINIVDDTSGDMKIQLIGLGNVGKKLINLIAEKRRQLVACGHAIDVVSVSDSKGTAIDKNGLNLEETLRYKELEWKGFAKYKRGYTAVDAVADVESDAVVELTPSTFSGEPGLSNIKTALTAKKHVVTANKGALVKAYKELVTVAREHGVELRYEATVAAHLPVFCLVESCFKADELQSVTGILNATTNYVLGEMEKGRNFQHALKKAIEAGWAETDCSDDIDGIDAARKTVILANALFNVDARLEDVQIEGIRHVEPLIKEAGKNNKKVKLICRIAKVNRRLEMSATPHQVSLSDPLATVNRGDMGIMFHFKTSDDIFVSARFLGPKQTAYAVLNDLLKIETETAD